MSRGQKENRIAYEISRGDDAKVPGRRVWLDIGLSTASSGHGDSVVHEEQSTGDDVIHETIAASHGEIVTSIQVRASGSTDADH